MGRAGWWEIREGWLLSIIGLLVLVQEFSGEGGGHFGSQETFDSQNDHFWLSELGRWGLLLAPGGWRPGMLLNVLWMGPHNKTGPHNQKW